MPCLARILAERYDRLEKFPNLYVLKGISPAE